MGFPEYLMRRKEKQMKLKSKELQELYDKVISGTFTFTPSGEDPVDKLFRECDEKLDEHISYSYLRELQDSMDIIEKSNGVLLSANMEAISEKRKLEHKIEELKSSCDYFEQSRDEWRSRAESAEADCKAYSELYRESCKTVQKLSIENKQLSEQISEAKADNEELKKHIDILSASEREALSAKKALEKDLDNASKRIKNLQEFNSEITSKNVDIATRNVELASKNELLKEHILENNKILANVISERDELEETLEKANADRTELQKDRDIWFNNNSARKRAIEELNEENKSLKARTDCLREEVKWYRKHYKEQSDKILELKSRLNSICGDEYRAEQKSLIHMRNYMTDFCKGRLCVGCPFESDEYKCGNGYSFEKKYSTDTRIIPDEELKEYYDKAKNYLRTFRNDCSCTFEATVNINKDLLNAICGIKPGEDDNG